MQPERDDARRREGINQSISKKKSNRLGWAKMEGEEECSVHGQRGARPHRLTLSFVHGAATPPTGYQNPTQPNPTQSPFFFFFTFLHTNLII
jgi:hypothetical protein